MLMNKIYQATVYAVDPKIDLDTRTIVIRALYPNRNEELNPDALHSNSSAVTDRQCNCNTNRSSDS